VPPKPVYRCRSDHPVYDVLADLAAWFEPVLRAKRFLHVDRLDPWCNFLEVLLHLASERAIAVHHDHERRNCPKIVYQEAAETRPASVWLPALQINELMAAQHAPALDLANVEAALRKEKVWLGSELFEGDESWMVDRTWFDEQVKKRRRRERRSKIANHPGSPIQAGTTFRENDSVVTVSG